MSRLAGLDALRAIAAIAVVLQHCTSAANKAGADLPFLDYFDPGRFGVACFFLISGYVIPSSFRQVRSFWIGRAFRILPVLWLSIGAHLALLSDASLLQIVANAFMVARPLGYELISQPYWTLEWELAFYLTCASLFALGLLGDRCVLFGLALACAIAGSIRSEFILAGLFFCGALFARKQGYLASLILCLAAIAVFRRPEVLAFVAAVPTFVLALRWQTPHRYLIGLGAVSYPLYLFHPLLVGLFFGAGPVAYFYFVLGGSVVLAGLVHRFVEEPMNRLGRIVLRSPRPDAATSGLAVTDRSVETV